MMPWIYIAPFMTKRHLKAQTETIIHSHFRGGCKVYCSHSCPWAYCQRPGCQFAPAAHSNEAKWVKVNDNYWDGAGYEKHPPFGYWKRVVAN